MGPVPDERSRCGSIRDLEADEHAEGVVAEMEYRRVVPRVEARQSRRRAAEQRRPSLGERHQSALVIAAHAVVGDEQVGRVEACEVAARAAEDPGPAREQRGLVGLDESVEDGPGGAVVFDVHRERALGPDEQSGPSRGGLLGRSQVTLERARRLVGGVHVDGDHLGPRPGRRRRRQSQHSPAGGPEREPDTGQHRSDRPRARPG